MRQATRRAKPVTAHGRLLTDRARCLQSGTPVTSTIRRGHLPAVVGTGLELRGASGGQLGVFHTASSVKLPPRAKTGFTLRAYFVIHCFVGFGAEVGTVNGVERSWPDLLFTVCRRKSAMLEAGPGGVELFNAASGRRLVNQRASPSDS